MDLIFFFSKCHSKFCGDSAAASVCREANNAQLIGFFFCTPHSLYLCISQDSYFTYDGAV